MSEISWVKITVDMFDNRKIKQIRGLPEGNNIVLVWIMLLTIAGRCNAGGMIFLTENIAYTAESLARELDFEVPFIKMAIDTLSHFGMIRCDSSEFSIVNWEEYQNVDGMEKAKMLNRERQKRWYDKQKALPNVSPNASLTQPNDTDIDKDIDKDKESNNKSKGFKPPTFEEVEAYCKERNSPVDPKQFYEYFSIGNWIDSKGKKVQNWKQKLLTWEKLGNGTRQNKPVHSNDPKNSGSVSGKYQIKYDNED